MNEMFVEGREKIVIRMSKIEGTVVYYGGGRVVLLSEKSNDGIAGTKLKWPLQEMAWLPFQKSNNVFLPVTNSEFSLNQTM